MQKVSSALARRLALKGWPVITEYELFLEFCRIYELSERERKQLYLRDPNPKISRFKRVVRDLKKARYLRADVDFHGKTDEFSPNIPQHVNVYRVSDVSDGSAEDISALVDPFCSISHLSAMQYYGFTNRHPADLIITTADISTWRQLRDEKQNNDTQALNFENVLRREYEMMRLKRVSFPSLLRKRKLSIHKTKRLTHTVQARDGFRRVPLAEDVFVQMLDRPDLCGGMAHVMDVWSEYVPDRIEKLVKRINELPDAILKVRAGFLLDESLKLKHPVIDSWTKFAQRGGSRRLDSSKPYLPRFSAKWMISLNVDSPLVSENN